MSLGQCPPSVSVPPGLWLLRARWLHHGIPTAPRAWAQGMTGPGRAAGTLGLFLRQAPVMGKQPSNADRGFWGPHRQRHGTPAASKRNLIFQIAFQLKGLRSSLQTSRGGPRHCF